MPVPPRLLVPAVIASLALVAACSSSSGTDPGPPSTTTTPSTSASAPSPTAPQPTSRPPTPSPSPSPTHKPTALLPLRASTGSATQVVTVVAPTTSSTTATLQAWTKNASGWHRVGAAVPAHVGSNGLTPTPSEGESATPIGSFTLTQAFGSAANPGTKVPYFRTDAGDWWVSDVSSPYYNTHYRCSGSCPFDTSAGENLRDAGFVYTYAVVIDYNRAPVVKGAGSAFFLHVTNGQATAGCVSIPEASLVSIMRWLNPSAHPRILIGTT
ncbi:MAG TPA: L,D-transpeptidase family protein [Jatrophihabitantaceae bacterium]|nr:L,D-transpeptidase family protein [Jatrophihabitantaceae bacterium]